MRRGSLCVFASLRPLLLFFNAKAQRRGAFSKTSEERSGAEGRRKKKAKANHGGELGQAGRSRKPVQKPDVLFDFENLHRTDGHSASRLCVGWCFIF